MISFSAKGCGARCNATRSWLRFSPVTNTSLRMSFSIALGKCRGETSRATVYRTLGLLVEADLLRQIDLGDSQVTYDPNFLDKPSHNHLVCKDCGRVVEFEDENVDIQMDCVTRRLGFRALRRSVKIEASCEQLRLKGRCPNLIATRLSGKRLRRKR